MAVIRQLTPNLCACRLGTMLCTALTTLITNCYSKTKKGLYRYLSAATWHMCNISQKQNFPHMSGTLGYSSHVLCPRARRVHFRIFLWFSILCSYAAFIKHLLFFFSPGKINILTSKQIRQWSWIQNNPLWETQNTKKNLSQKCDIALNCWVHTYLYHQLLLCGNRAVPLHAVCRGELVLL